MKLVGLYAAVLSAAVTATRHSSDPGAQQCVHAVDSYKSPGCGGAPVSGTMREVHTTPVLVDRAEEDEAGLSAALVWAELENRKYNEGFGAALIATIALVMVYGAVQNFCFAMGKRVLTKFDGRVSRAIRKKFLLAPTFKKHHSEQVVWFNWFTLNIPTRPQTLVLIVLFVQNFVYLFLGYTILDPVAHPEAGLRCRQICTALGIRTGVLVAYQLPFLWLFSGRNNFLIWVTGWPLDTFNVLHKWIARGVMVNLCVHGLAFTTSYVIANVYTQMWLVRYWIAANIAFYAGLIIFVQSMHRLRLARYDLFLGLHIFLALVFVIGAVVHLCQLMYYEWVYTALAWWIVERVTRVMRIIVSGTKSKSTVALLSGGIIRIDIGYSNRWKFYPGCYGFVHFAQRNRFWQNHPFTFIHDPNDCTKLQIFARVKDGITKKMQAKLEQADGNRLEMSTWIDGPYGHQPPVHKYDKVCYIAGGIGVTGTYTHAQDLVRLPRDANYLFLWVVSDLSPLTWFGEHLKHLLTDERFEVQIWCRNQTVSPSLSEDDKLDDEDTTVNLSEMNSQVKGEQEKITALGSVEGALALLQTYPNFSFNEGHPNWNDTVTARANTYTSATRSMAVVSCGPGSMNDDVRLAVGAALDSAPGRVDYFEESFSW